MILPDISKGCLHMQTAWCISCVKALVEMIKLEWASSDYEVKQILGKALGYPLAYPEVSLVNDGSVVTGEHVAATLAQEAADRIKELEDGVDKAINILIT